MTDEQINAAIADACGWKPDKRGLGWLSPHGYYAPEPDYCNDLNAMHEAEATLTEDQLWRMAREIERNDEQWYFRATARQRAETFLRTLGKWEEAVVKESLTAGATTEDSSAVQSTSSGVSGGMSLVQQLRDTAKMGVCDEDCLMLDAADRIEKLEAALEQIRDCNWPGTNAEILSHWEMRNVAREALI
jgi:hypothetical protein